MSSVPCSKSTCLPTISPCVSRRDVNRTLLVGQGENYFGRQLLNVGICGSCPNADTRSIGGFRPARPEVVQKSGSEDRLCSPLSPGGPFSSLQGGTPPQYPNRLFTMFFSGSPFSNLRYCSRKKRVA